MSGAVLVSGGSSVRARAGAAAACPVRSALERGKEKEMERLNAERGRRFAPSPYLLTGRRRSCARDLLCTISVTGEELTPTI